MQKLREKLNANAVGANCIRPHFVGMTLKKEKGITLIALIITIIVMLILVGVTINVALNGDLFTKAETAVNQTQLEVEKETLQNIALGFLGDNGEMNFAEFETEYTGKTVEGYTIKSEGEYASATKGETIFYINKYGGISEEKPELVDDSVIVTILTNLFSNQITEDVAVSQLKEHMSITDEDVNIFNDICFVFEVDTTYAYIYKIDRLYKLDTDTVIYAEEEQHSEQYTFGRNTKSAIKQLKDLFVGETVDGIYEECEGDIESYIVENSENITGADIAFDILNEKRISEIKNITIWDDFLDIRIILQTSREDDIYNDIDCYFSDWGT